MEPICKEKVVMMVVTLREGRFFVHNDRASCSARPHRQARWPESRVESGASRHVGRVRRR